MEPGTVGAPEANPSEVDRRGGPPPLQAGLIPRAQLITGLCATRDRVVAVLAPAGYGKTSLLAEWAVRDTRAFAWLALDSGDNDPTALLRRVAVELADAGSLDPAVIDVTTQPMVSIRPTALPLLSRAFRSSRQPVVVVMDDVHQIENADALDSIAALAENIPEGSAVVLCGRGENGLPLARLRAVGRLTEIGADDLALQEAQAIELLQAVVGDLDTDLALEVARRCEGWPVGLYLAGLAMARQPAAAHPTIGVRGDDRFVRDYVRAEILSQLPADEREFLTRTSILTWTCGELCDAVLERTGSQQVLEGIERSNRLLLPLDRHRRWYRSHDLFREALEADLEAYEPHLIQGLRQRAAQWYAERGMPERAFEQAIAMGDLDQARALLEQLILPVFHEGRIATLVTWIDRLGEELAERHQTLATVSAWAGMVTGNAARAERWGRVAEREHAQRRTQGDVGPVPFFTFRAHLCPDGSASMLEDAQRAVREVSEASPWRGPTLLVHGVALVLDDQPDQADAAFEAATEVGLKGGATLAATIALAERSMLAASREDWSTAEGLVSRSAELVLSARLEEYPFSGITFAAAAHVASHTRDTEASRTAAVKAQLVLPLLTRALPWLALQTRIELARASVGMMDVAGARVLLLEIDDILRKVPTMGRLSGEVVSLRAEIEQMGVRINPGVSSLTTAELRLMPYLPTHLSFREVGQRLFLSENTVKTQAVSIYRKLGVSSRSAAVEAAEQVGLLHL